MVFFFLLCDRRDTWSKWRSTVPWVVPWCLFRTSVWDRQGPRPIEQTESSRLSRLHCGCRTWGDPFPRGRDNDRQRQGGNQSVCTTGAPLGHASDCQRIMSIYKSHPYVLVYLFPDFLLQDIEVLSDIFVAWGRQAGCAASEQQARCQDISYDVDSDERPKRGTHFLSWR